MITEEDCVKHVAYIVRYEIALKLLRIFSDLAMIINTAHYVQTIDLV